MFAVLARLRGRDFPADDLAVQWDVAVEFSVLEEAFAPGGAPAFDYASSPPGSSGVLDQVPAEIPAGLHLCYGDYGHQLSCSPRRWPCRSGC